MTLNQTEWKIFDEDPKTHMEGFCTQVQQQMTVVEEASVNPMVSVESALIKRRGGRLNTKLRQQSTVQDFSLGEQVEQIHNFWERNFPDEEEVAWYKFQKAFLDDYESKLSGGVPRGS